MRADGGDGGGFGVDLTPLWRWLLTSVGLTVVAVVVVLLIVVTVVAGLLLRRAIRRRLRAGRQFVDRAMTGWRAQALPAGPRRRLAELRAQLEDALAATDRQAGQVRPGAAAPLALLPELTGQLRAAGRSMDAHLRELEREPDDGRLTVALPAAERQVGEWCTASASVREGVRSAGAAATAGQVHELTAQVELEVAAVQAGVDYLTTPGEPRG